MAPAPLAWLLHLAALCHLIALLAGQHLGVTKCNITCATMSRKPIPVALLINYWQNQRSCGKPAIVLETKQHRLFCADPKEKWVQEVMGHLDSQAAAPIQNGGTFEKQIGVVKPGATPATRGLSHPVPTEPKATGESRRLGLIISSQEAQRPMGTSLEPPMAVTASSGTRSPPASEAGDRGPTAGPEATGNSHAAAVSTTSTWQGSVAHLPGSGLWAEGEATEVSSTSALSTEPPSPMSHSTQAPTILNREPEAHVGSEGQPAWVQGQSPTLENSLGAKEEMDPVSAPTEALWRQGPGSTAHPPMMPVSSAGSPSWEPVASGSWAPKAEEPVHATADPQRLSVLITPVPDSQAATRRQAVGLLAFLGLLFCLGVAMFAYQSLQGCPRKTAGEVVEGLRYVPRSCGSTSYVLVPV